MMRIRFSMKVLAVVAGLLHAGCAFAQASVSNDTLTVRIKGMRCEECAHKVMTTLRKDIGVKDIHFNLERRTATIVYNAKQTSTDSIYAHLEATKRYKGSAYSAADVIRRGYGQRIDDMRCQQCADSITSRLQLMPGIDSLAPHLDKHYLFIRYDANRTSKAEIRAFINDLGFTPVNYYTSDKIGWGYYSIPAEQATQETIDNVLAIDGVEDVNVNARRGTMAVTFFSQEISDEKLLDEILKSGIKAVVPSSHDCHIIQH